MSNHSEKFSHFLIYQSEADIFFQSLERWFESGEKRLEEVLEKARQEYIEEWGLSEDEDNKDDLAAIEDFEMTTEGFLQYHHYGMTIVSAIAYVEFIVNKICDLYKHRLKVRISFKDLKGAGLYRASDYLSKVVSIPPLSTLTRWEQMTELKKVRNEFAHGGSRWSINPRIHEITKKWGCEDSIGFPSYEKLCKKAISYCNDFIKETIEHCTRYKNLMYPPEKEYE